eukprot:1606054-Pyramimonas_sp.AAC.1
MPNLWWPVSPARDAVHEVSQVLHSAVREATPPSRMPAAGSNTSAWLECATNSTKSLRRNVSDALQQAV